MILSPREIPLGAMRFNSDSQKLEYWMGSAWMQIQTFSEVLSGGIRGVFMTGYGPADTNKIDYVSLATGGVAVDFGDDTLSRRQSGGCSSRTRGINAAGTPDVDTISFIEIVSAGDAQDFGNLSGGRNGGPAGCSDSTRGIICGGGSPTQDTIEFVTFSTKSDATDFGNLVESAQHFGGSANSPTRGVIAGGYTPSVINTIQFVTIASTGNAVDFGDSTVLRRSGGLGPSSNVVRGIFAGGYSPSRTNSMDFITIATEGNATDFGDLVATTSAPATTASSTRVVIAGGFDGSNFTNVIDVVEIATIGNSVKFGDLTDGREQVVGVSNGHGGLG